MRVSVSCPGVFRVTCSTPVLADRFIAYLSGHSVLAAGLEGSDVLVPWTGDLTFVFSVFEAAVLHGYTESDVAARQQEECLPIGVW